METSILPDAEFKTLILMVLIELSGRVEEISENYNKEVGAIQDGGEVGGSYTPPPRTSLEL